MREVFKAKRLELGLSQNKVNEVCGFAPARYAVIERGTKEATQEEVSRIIEVLGIEQQNTKKEKTHGKPKHAPSRASQPTEYVPAPDIA